MEVKFKKVKTISDIKNLPFVDQFFKDSDGWWCWLKEGYISTEMECGTIHEQTVSEVCKMINICGIEKT
jgi:hypothetical protein